MKKGFTLIELLAVILILGIIALIAVPQVTNVIENANKGAAETSAEHYVGAVNTKIGLNKLDNDSSNDINTSVKDVSELVVDISGEVPTSGKVYIENGAVKQAELVVNGYDVTCDEKGKCEAVKDYRYYASNGAPSNTDETLKLRPIDKRVYLKYAIVNDMLGTPQTCIYENDKELCLRLGEYEITKSKIIDYYGFNDETWSKYSSWWEDSVDDTKWCTFDDNVPIVKHGEQVGELTQIQSADCGMGSDEVTAFAYRWPEWVLDRDDTKCVNSPCDGLVDYVSTYSYTGNDFDFTCILSGNYIKCSDNEDDLLNAYGGE